MDKIKLKNIFTAVSNKSILDPLLSVLDQKSVKFWGTEGTVKYLKSKGFSAKSVVSDFDFDGRVKSLDKKVFAAILADRTKKKHLEELRKLNQTMFSSHSRLDRESLETGPSGRMSDPRVREDDGSVLASPFDLVIVDLYPLDTKNFPESMDIGGQALIRAAVKNYKNIAVAAFDKSSIGQLIQELSKNGGSTTFAFRQTQAKKALKFISEKAAKEASLFKF